ncbi:hypothetical protein HQ40_05035 [Porphyromonas gulae]|uniref:ATP-grasp domain-containing protein n=1 Tax=Porphyromonas gulae TaxID=111105 RepID=UPI00052D792E|nr:hypothetical protein [Porphyromonas gulae]KGN76149.1 hypothetical protein HQ40_05035 [Porphyromonas gulae]
MKIAIHHRPGSFSDRWIQYCEEKGISYLIVNAYDSDIVSQIKNCDAFMWHHHHGDYRDQLFAKSLIFALESGGKIVFPNTSTCWHFDDKIAQKYLFEVLDIPSAKSHVYYDKKSASEFIQKTELPQVFKLKGGAGSANVALIDTRNKGIRRIKKSFSRGYSSSNYLFSAKTNLELFLRKKTSFFNVIKYLALYLFPKKFNVHLLPRHKGYFLTQDFIPNEGYDIRVVVIGDRAFAVKRNVRKQDFRASGSGLIESQKELFSQELIAKSFNISDKLRMQICSFDFVRNANTGEFLLIEISYGTCYRIYANCEGYWTRDLSWHHEIFDPRDWIVDIVIDKIQSNKITTDPQITL